MLLKFQCKRCKKQLTDLFYDTQGLNQGNPDKLVSDSSKKFHAPVPLGLLIFALYYNHYLFII